MLHHDNRFAISLICSTLPTPPFPLPNSEAHLALSLPWKGYRILPPLHTHQRERKKTCPPLSSQISIPFLLKLTFFYPTNHYFHLPSISTPSCSVFIFFHISFSPSISATAQLTLAGVFVVIPRVVPTLFSSLLPLDFPLLSQCFIEFVTFPPPLQSLCYHPWSFRNLWIQPNAL